jgi:hypothetical protein
VLANGGETITVNSGATSFAFLNTLASGASFAVTAQTVPTGLTCSVASGSGSIASANVNNVVVTCAPQAFTLGGTINGLRTAGLVLAQGNDRLTVAANATQFAFTNPLAVEGSYGVSVETQPIGASCGVTNGSGVMPVGNVAQVVIGCSDQPYTLGGTIAGLSTTGLVLANAGDTLGVAANATQFTLPTALAYDRAYAVTVQSQPAGLTCSVSSGSGNMPASNVSSVAITCSPQSYTVGGTISGLGIAGLVLANGSDTIAPAVNATQFTMPASVAFGAGYALTVSSQPAGRTCTISNGAGIMPVGGVTNVSVVCSANTYSVGGSVAALTANGLVLANGSDTLSVAANATLFTMPTGVASGSNYSLVVQTQPTAQLCTLSNATGTVGAANVSNAQVSCGSGVISFSTVGAASWTVPTGVTSIRIVAIGGGGGGDFETAGGSGAVVTATRAVTAGQVLTVFVGGGGTGAPGGGGGGGASQVDAGGSTQVIAGGGGGAGDGISAGNGGTPAGQKGAASGGGNGGSGGVGGVAGAGAGSGGNGNGGAGGLGAMARAAGQVRAAEPAATPLPASTRAAAAAAVTAAEPGLTRSLSSMAAAAAAAASARPARSTRWAATAAWAEAATAAMGRS